MTTRTADLKLNVSDNLEELADRLDAEETGEDTSDLRAMAKRLAGRCIPFDEWAGKA